MPIERIQINLILFFASLSLAFGHETSHTETTFKEVPGIPSREAWRGNAIDGPWVLHGLFCPRFYSDKNLNFPKGETERGTLSLVQILKDLPREAPLDIEHKIKDALPHIDQTITEIAKLEKEVAVLLKDYEFTHSLGKNLEKAKKLQRQIENFGVPVTRTGPEPNPHKLSQALSGFKMQRIKGDFQGYRYALERTLKEVGRVQFKKDEAQNDSQILNRDPKDWSLPIRFSQKTSYQKQMTQSGEIQLKEVLSLGSQGQWRVALDLQGKAYVKNISQTNDQETQYKTLCTNEKTLEEQEQNLVEKMLNNRRIKFSKEECKKLKELADKEAREAMGPHSNPLLEGVEVDELLGSKIYDEYLSPHNPQGKKIIIPIDNTKPSEEQKSFYEKLHQFANSDIAGHLKEQQTHKESIEKASRGEIKAEEVSQSAAYGGSEALSLDLSDTEGTIQKLTAQVEIQEQIKQGFLPLSEIFKNHHYLEEDLGYNFFYKPEINPHTGHLEVFLATQKGGRIDFEADSFRITNTPFFTIDKGNLPKDIQNTLNKHPIKSFGSIHQVLQLAFECP